VPPLFLTVFSSLFFRWRQRTSEHEQRYRQQSGSIVRKRSSHVGTMTGWQTRINSVLNMSSIVLTWRSSGVARSTCLLPWSSIVLKRSCRVLSPGAAVFLPEQQCVLNIKRSKMLWVCTRIIHDYTLGYNDFDFLLQLGASQAIDGCQIKF
jgi:hypothetical protein